MANDFSKGEVWRIVLAQALPLTLASFVQLLYNVVDRIYIGHLSGSGGMALTGVGVVDYVVTEKCVFHFTKEGMVLEELAPGETVESIKAVTDCDMIIPDVIKSMEE